MARQSKKLIQEVNIENCEEAFVKYNNATSQLQVLEGNMNKAITAIKEKFESKITGLQEEKDDAFEMMQAYAEAHPEQFEKKKSMGFTHGIIGFRTGTPKLQPRKGFKWAGVLETIKESFGKYIRVKEELNKELLLADRNTIDLKEMHLEVIQDETFYVEPNLEVVSMN